MSSNATIWPRRLNRPSTTDGAVTRRVTVRSRHHLPHPPQWQGVEIIPDRKQQGHAWSSGRGSSVPVAGAGGGGFEVAGEVVEASGGGGDLLGGR